MQKNNNNNDYYKKNNQPTFDENVQVFNYNVENDKDTFIPLMFEELGFSKNNSNNSNNSNYENNNNNKKKLKDSIELKDSVESMNQLLSASSNKLLDEYKTLKPILKKIKFNDDDDNNNKEIFDNDNDMPQKYNNNKLSLSTVVNKMQDLKQKYVINSGDNNNSNAFIENLFTKKKKNNAIN